MNDLTTSKILEFASMAFDEQITINSNSENTSGWDSLSYLSLLTALNDFTNGKTEAIEGLSKADSLVEVIELLKKADLVSE